VTARDEAYGIRAGRKTERHTGRSLRSLEVQDPTSVCPSGSHLLPREKAWRMEVVRGVEGAASSKHKIPCFIFRKRKIPRVSWLLLSPKSQGFSGTPFCPYEKERQLCVGAVCDRPGPGVWKSAVCRERMGMKRKQFTFYGSFFEAMSEMGMVARGKAITALCEYALYGIEPPSMKGALKIYMDLVMPNLDAARKKAESGAKGGRHKKASKQESKGENEVEIKKELEIELETETNCGKGEDALRLGSGWLGFERFWNLYPVKIGKEEAWEVWQRLCPEEAAACDNLERWMRTGQWRKENGRYIPRAARFLELGQHLQKPEAGLPTGASGKLGKAELEALEQLMRKDLT